MGVSRAPPVPGTSTLYVFIARASVVRAGLPSVVAPRHRESARSTDGCRYARAGHAARVRFTLIDLKFTKYVENDTRFMHWVCFAHEVLMGVGSAPSRARAGHGARVRFTLMDLKFTKYLENDTRFIVHWFAHEVRMGVGSRDETALTDHRKTHTARTARPSSRPAPASPSFADAR